MDAKDEIKRRLSLEDVVGDYLELKRAGRNWKAISPFTAEKTPSFMVSPEKQIWHDFSSNKGGDMFTFVMEVEGVDFREALEILAKKALVDLSQFQKGDGSASKLRKRLLEAHKHASDFYHLQLSIEKNALQYIKQKRGFLAETIRTWKLGYSPESGKKLYTYLQSKGFSDGELIKAGLVTRRSNGVGDMFRGRIMVPLADGQGNVVGFTARLLKDDKNAPKYFNTPQTPLYDKGRQVFGLHHAKEAIRKADSVVIVEGNFDVISSHQAGVKNVVACAGTALTADHLRSLSRLTMNISLAFDADDAGLNATERAIAIAQEVGVELQVVVMPGDAKDPDELIAQDSSLWQHAINHPQNAVSWILSRYGRLYDKSTAEGKKQLSDKALGIVKKLQDPVEQEHHIQVLSSELGVSTQSLMTKLRKTGTRHMVKKQIKAVQFSSDETAYEDDLLALNAYFPDVRDSLKLVLHCKFHSEQREAAKREISALGLHEVLLVSGDDTLKIDANYAKILQLLVEEKYIGWNPADVMAEAMALARRVHTQYQNEIKKSLTQEIAAAESRGDHEEAARLLQEYQRLLKEL
jgi:DNA primase